MFTTKDKLIYSQVLLLRQAMLTLLVLILSLMHQNLFQGIFHPPKCKVLIKLSLLFHRNLEVNIISADCKTNNQNNPSFQNCLSPLKLTTKLEDIGEKDSQIPAKRIFLKFTNGPTQKIEATYLIILDTGNHCVRKYNFKNQIVTTIAGVCGQKGFLDGPLGNSLFDTPNKLGLSSQGEIFVFDKGNKYIRKLVKKSQDSDEWLVKTMWNGACRDIEEVKGYSGLEWMGLDSSASIGKFCFIF